MSKLTKLINNPTLFLTDMLQKKAHYLNRPYLKKVDDILVRGGKYSKRINPNNSRLNANDTLDKTIKQVKKNEIGLQYQSILLPKWLKLEENDFECIQSDLFLIVSSKQKVVFTLKNLLKCNEFKIEDIDLFNYQLCSEVEIDQYITRYYNQFEKIVKHRLIFLKSKIKALVFTEDTAIYQKVIIKIATNLGIPCILIPVIDSATYLDNEYKLGLLPRADSNTINLYVNDNIELDSLVLFTREYHLEALNLTREQWYNLIGFDENVLTIVFDLKLDHSTQKIREQLRSNIKTLLDLNERFIFQLVLRGDSDLEKILGPALLKNIMTRDNVVIDLEPFISLSQDMLVKYTDIVISWDSMIVFDAIKYNKKALWLNLKLEALSSKLNILKVLDETIFLDTKEVSYVGIDKYLNTEKNIKLLKEILINTFIENICPYVAQSAIDRFYLGHNMNKIATEFGEKALGSTHKYLQQLLKTNILVQSNPKTKNINELIDVDMFIQWGIKETSTKDWQHKVAKSFKIPKIIIEDGFVRSIDIGLSGEAGLAIITDDTTAYYDATNVSQLERRIQSDHELNDDQILYANNLIEKIITHRISKYNHAPNLDLNIGRYNVPKLLLIDQRAGDQSIIKGLANENSFDRMLDDAINLYPDYDILIKQHPDAIKGGKESYLNNEKLRFAKFADNIFIIDFDVNPHVLFNQVEKVFVATSGMGFEALLAGKEVHCYGMPFYAGWGVTVDKIQLERRTRKRKVNEIFYYSYVEFSRYFNPTLNKICDLDSLINEIILKRGW